MTPEEQILHYSKNKQFVDPKEAAILYNKLKSIKPEFLIGEWDMGYFDTGHPAINDVVNIEKVIGKVFNNINDVDPAIILDSEGNRIVLKKFGKAILREVIFKDKLSTCMIYNNIPVLAHFRYINENQVFAAIEDLGYKYDGIMYFTIKRNINIIKNKL